MHERSKTAGTNADGRPVAAAPSAAAAPAPALAPDASSKPRLSTWTILSIAALTLTAATACFTHVWDSDTFWHLASGEWMLAHKQVLGTDPFSIDPMPQWVNVHWLFQVVLASLYAVGGFELLSVMTAVLAGAVFFTYAYGLRRKVSPALLVAVGLAMLSLMSARFRTRPESFTFLYLMLTVLLVDSARQGGNPRRLWWLVPIMLLWVNMHGVFILGLGVIWGAVAGAGLDKLFHRGQLSAPLLKKEAIGPMLVATAGCLVTPWPLEAAIQPLLLWTRVSGENQFYTYGVSELRPTWEGLQHEHYLLGFIALAAMAMVINIRRLPLGHALWLGAFASLAMLAVRNIALLGPVAGFLLAWHAQETLDRLAAWKPALTKLRPAMAAIAIVACLAAAAGYGTEYFFRRGGMNSQIGAGLAKAEYATDLAKRLAALKVDGDILCDNFGEAGVYIYYGSVNRPKPSRLVFMDGRLEAHTLERFKEQHNIHLDLQSWQRAATAKIPPSVRFVVARHSATQVLTALASSRRFKLVCIDPVGVCFEVCDYRAKAPLPAETYNLRSYDHPLTPEGVAGREQPRASKWYSQNQISMNQRLGAMFLALGQSSYDPRERGISEPTRYRCALLAIRYLTLAHAEGLTRDARDVGALAHAYANRGFQAYVESPELPVDVSTARAMRIYDQLDLSDLNDECSRDVAFLRIGTLLLNSQFDTANKAIDDFLKGLPARLQIQPPQMYLGQRDIIRITLGKTESDARDEFEKSSKTPRDRIAIYARPSNCLYAKARPENSSPSIGLYDKALAELQALPQRDAAMQMLLGDLLLRGGKTAEAREAYASVKLPEADGWKLELRRILCDWVDGKLFDASAALAALAGKTNQPAVRFYQATLLEEIGDYAAARTAVAKATSDDEKMTKALETLRARLEVE